MTSLPDNLDEAEQLTAEVLIAVTTTGDMAAIGEILSRWPIQPDPHAALNGPGLWPFELVLYTGIQENQPRAVSYVLRRGLKLGRLAIERALVAGYIDIFEAFVDNGWDINAPLGEIEPPPLAYVLCQPSFVHHPPILPVNVWTPDAYAHKLFSRVLTNEPLVRWFLSNGASPNASSPRLARTPVMSAGGYAALHIVQLLYAHGAFHLDALQCAAESPKEGRLEVMEFLLDDGADIDAVKWKHHEESYRSFEALELGTALHYAAWAGHKDRVKLLLRRGANADILDSTGKTALDIAREYKREDIVALLSGHSVASDALAI